MMAAHAQGFRQNERLGKSLRTGLRIQNWSHGNYFHDLETMATITSIFSSWTTCLADAALLQKSHKNHR